MAEIVLVIRGLICFWPTVCAFIKIIKGIPVDQHAEVLKKVSEVFDETNPNHPGRPQWDKLQ